MGNGEEYMYKGEDMGEMRWARKRRKERWGGVVTVK